MSLDGVSQIMAAVRIRSQRLWILRLLDASAGYRSNDGVIRAGLEHVGLPIAHADLLAQLCYLEDNSLIRVKQRSDFAVWVIELTRAGQDVAQGLSLIEGIERPAPETI